MILNKREWAVLVAILVFSLVPAIGGLIRLVELSGGPAIIPPNPRAVAEPAPIIVHVLSSFLFCIVGAVQFLPSIRQRRPQAHRIAGRLVAAAGCVSALSGLWMTVLYTFPAELQGALLFWARVCVGLSMIGLIFMAIASARDHAFQRHRAAMLRAYAIGQGASTQAFMGLAAIVFLGTEPAGLTRDLVMITAWLVNLTVAEILIGRTRSARLSPV